MIKNILFFTILINLNINLFSQINHREYDENFMYTVFEDEFNGTDINRDCWKAVSIYRGIGQLIDSSLTYDVGNGKLELTMEHVPNYNDIADYVGQEFNTEESFLYGSFECKATFANGIGSWPAFWSFHDNPCQNGEGPEIDFAEYFCDLLLGTDRMEHNIHRWFCGGGGEESPIPYKYSSDFNASNTGNIYKCIWTPEKIDFYIDNVKEITFYNNGEDWYPYQSVKVILSQQILQPYNVIGQVISPVCPQTSYFDYVNVKKFFLAPEITISSDVICTSDTATLDVDDEATNITWHLSPTSLFSGSTSGTGKVATINRASGNSGEGTITYFFEMPSGETFDAENIFCVGTPKPTISSAWSEACNCYVSDPLETFTTYDWDMITCNTSTNTTDYVWEVRGYELPIFAQQSESTNGTRTTYPYTAYGKHLSYTFYDEQYYTIKAKQKMCGSWSSWANKYITVGDGLLMVIAPNPTGGETILSIESTSGEKTVDGNTVWELEIYSPSQALKEKITNIKGNNTKIQTQSWKEGVYVVRVKYKDEVLTGKLVVKK